MNLPAFNLLDFERTITFMAVLGGAFSQLGNVVGIVCLLNTGKLIDITPVPVTLLDADQ